MDTRSEAAEGEDKIDDEKVVESRSAEEQELAGRKEKELELLKKQSRDRSMCAAYDSQGNSDPGIEANKHDGPRGSAIEQQVLSACLSGRGPAQEY